MIRELLSGQFDLTTVIIRILSALAVVFLTLPIHEFAHAFTAVKLGDNTPRWMGRYTVNPFAHIDYLGALFIILFGFGWAKPVSVNANNFRNPKRDMAITALAGPISNILVAFISLFICNLFLSVYYKASFEILFYLSFFFSYVAQINVYLAVFNLIPIPPFDGSRLLSALLPDRYYYKLMRYEKYFLPILLILLLTDILTKPLSIISNTLLIGLNGITSFPFNLF